MGGQNGSNMKFASNDTHSQVFVWRLIHDCNMLCSYDNPCYHIYGCILLFSAIPIQISKERNCLSLQTVYSCFLTRDHFVSGQQKSQNFIVI